LVTTCTKVVVGVPGSLVGRKEPTVPDATPRDPELRSGHLRAAAAVSLASFLWTTVASGTAVVVGVVARSLVLVAFGLTGFLDAGGSMTLWFHFQHALRHEEVSIKREKMALRFITMGLITVGVLTSVESVRRLVVGADPGHTGFGLVLAGCSMIVLAVLAARKGALAKRIPSGALLADSYLSAVGAALAAITLVGASLLASGGPSWIDAVAALIVALVAAAVGIIEFPREAGALRRES
jgi:divalent metal cation (Fe/Co/Zn/Cd) transporter